MEALRCLKHSNAFVITMLYVPGHYFPFHIERVRGVRRSPFAQTWESDVLEKLCRKRVLSINIDILSEFDSSLADIPVMRGGMLPFQKLSEEQRTRMQRNREEALRRRNQKFDI